MDIVKKKLKQLKNALAEAEVRATKAEEELSVTNGKVDAAEEEGKNLIEQIDAIEDKLDGIESKLNSTLSEANEAEKRGDENERIRKGLEGRTATDSEKADTYTKEYEIITAKNEIAEAELEKVLSELGDEEDKAEDLEEQGHELEERVRDTEEEVTLVGNNLRSMEITGEQGGEREDKQNTILDDLTNKYIEIAQTADEGEAQVLALEGNLAMLEDKLEEEKENYAKTKSEYEQAMYEITDM